MSDEKIIFKFQTLQSIFDTSIVHLTQEKNTKKSEFEEFNKLLIRTRNEFLAGIGFVISILLVLVQMDLFPSFHILHIFILIVAGLVVYLVFNEYGYHRSKIYRKLNLIYISIIYDELFPFQHYFVSESLYDRLDENRILDYANELSRISRTQSFCLQYFSYKNLKKHTSPNLSEYQDLFQEIKNVNQSEVSLNSIKNRYSEFVKNFNDLQNSIQKK